MRGIHAEKVRLAVKGWVKSEYGFHQACSEIQSKYGVTHGEQKRIRLGALLEIFKSVSHANIFKCRHVLDNQSALLLKLIRTRLICFFMPAKYEKLILSLLVHYQVLTTDNG